MTGVFSVIVPEATTNLILNPSGEISGSYASGAGGTVTRSTDRARFGVYSFKIVIGSPTAGIEFSVNALANAAHFLTAYLYSADASQTYTFAVGTTTREATRLSGDAGWQRWGCAFTAGECNGKTVVDVLGDLAGTFYVDGAQLEAKTYPTTYIDGDQPGGSWAGLWQGSASSRDANYRLGGVEDNLDDYGIIVDDSLTGIGLPPVVNNTIDYALQPGAQFQSTQIKSRVLDLVLTLAGTSLAGLLQKRQDVIALFGPARGSQAVRLGYADANGEAPIYLDTRYVQGMQFQNVQGFIEKPVLRLLAVDPLWYADDQEQAPLTLQQSVSNAAYILRRQAGQWQALGTGGDSSVYALTLGQDGTLYAGGDFTAMGGVSNTAYIAKWNGSAWSALGTGANTDVQALAVGPDGSLYAGGVFTAMGGVANTAYIAKWNGSAWSALSTGANGAVLALALGPDGTLYAGGAFTLMAGVANTVHIAKWNGSAWSALSTGANGNIRVLGIGVDGALYAAGEFTTIGGVSANRIAKWNGSAWVALGAGMDNTIYAMVIGRDGKLYAGGSFTTAGGTAAAGIAQWNGSAWAVLGSGVNATVYALAVDSDGTLIVGGNFTTAGGLSVADRLAGWNGSAWYHLDVDLPGSPAISACLIRNGFIVVGYNTTGTATAAALTTVTPSASADLSPLLTLIGPSSSTLVLQWIENQTTKQRLYFNLTVNAGEVITIDLRTGQKTVASNWRGLIGNQPLRNSDFANWRLQPGANTIAAFVTGTTTGAALLASWTPAYLSVDGAA